MIETVKFARKAFFVDAVQVTAENMEEVAAWAQGEIRSEAAVPEGEIKYVHIRVARPLNERQTKAYIGDWVLYAGTGYKVYTNKAFFASFEPAEKNQAVQVTNIFNNAEPSAEVTGGSIAAGGGGGTHI